MPLALDQMIEETGFLMADAVLGVEKPLVVIAATSVERLMEAELLPPAPPDQSSSRLCAVVPSAKSIGAKHFSRANYYTDKTLGLTVGHRLSRSSPNNSWLSINHFSASDMRSRARINPASRRPSPGRGQGRRAWRGFRGGVFSTGLSGEAGGEVGFALRGGGQASATARTCSGRVEARVAGVGSLGGLAAGLRRGRRPGPWRRAAGALGFWNPGVASGWCRRLLRGGARHLEPPGAPAGFRVGGGGEVAPAVGFQHGGVQPSWICCNTATRPCSWMVSCPWW